MHRMTTFAGEAIALLSPFVPILREAQRRPETFVRVVLIFLIRRSCDRVLEVRIIDGLAEALHDVVHPSDAADNPEWIIAVECFVDLEIAVYILRALPNQCAS